ncbi:MAG TPA: hypothetical protein VHT25_12820 [Solirubrobacteraceae bacterium]|jgi:hypothetical protein|nr:hypothetical protein [Solirubrobacteraceae bacterium]
MKLRTRIVVAVLLICAWLLPAAVAWAAETVTVNARFTPEELGAPTNLSATATFHSTTTGPQPPATKVTVYGPAGMLVDTRGAGTCTATPARLVDVGPSACPASSRIGFGKGVVLAELASQLINGEFTLELFLAPSEHKKHVILIYVNAFTPSSEQQVLVAKEVRRPKPYGIGITFDVPITQSLPGASLGWEEHVSLTIGASHVAYYKTVHGARKLVHVRGIVLPKQCPRGGFPFESEIGFADSTATVAKTAIPCPR